MSTERVEVAEVLLTRDEVADRLKISTRTVDRYIADGDLVAKRLGAGGRLVRIPESALAALTDSSSADRPPVDGGPHAPGTGSQPGGGGTSTSPVVVPDPADRGRPDAA